MMLFVSVVKLSGVFEFLAIKCARLAKGDPWKIMLLFVLLTAVLSAFLDNVTTVLLIGPMTLTVCKLLDVNPIPFFMTEILASNIGGTATLIGDPPNIMIGSAAGYSFFDFILYDAPAVAIILVAILGVFCKRLQILVGGFQIPNLDMPGVTTQYAITNWQAGFTGAIRAWSMLRSRSNSASRSACSPCAFCSCCWG